MRPNRFEGEDDPQLSELLGALPRVMAPADFETRLRSRIARRRSAAGPRWLRPALAAAAVAVLVGGTFLLTMPESPSLIAEAVVSSDPRPIGPLPGTSFEARGDRTDLRTSVSGAERSAGGAGRRQSERDVPFGSVEMSSRTSEPRQAEFNRGATPKGPVTFERPASISASGLLSELGIETKSENGKLRVSAVRPNSLGERSGVRADDIVESVDEKPISSDTVFSKSAEGKSITVRRDGRSVRLVLLGQ